MNKFFKDVIIPSSSTFNILLFLQIIKIILLKFLLNHPYIKCRSSQVLIGLLHHQRKEAIMPEISRFYGIVIKMFFKPKEHEPPHIHALYGEYVGLFDLKTGKMFEGDFPVKAQDLVTEWITLTKDELLRMWETQVITKLPPLL